MRPTFLRRKVKYTIYTNLIIYPISLTPKKTMNTYECKKCGMSVNAQCGKCNLPLENAYLTLENGVVVQISQCPSCMGKIKSPQCCGADMNCELN